MRTTIFLTLLAVACSSGKSDSGDPTGFTTPTTDDTGATPGGTTTPTSWDDWTLSGTLEVAANAEVPQGSVVVALVTYDPYLYTHRDILVQTTAGQLTKGGSLAFSLDVPGTPDASYFSSNPSDPFDNAAAFVVGAYIDENGDGLADEGDTFVAASDNWFVLFDGQPSGNFFFSGFDVGWNQADLSDPWGYFITGTPLSGDVSGHSVAANLVPTKPDPGLTLVVEPAQPGGRPASARVEISHTYWLLGTSEPADPIIFTSPLTGEANEVVDVNSDLMTPPADHLTEFSGYYAMPGILAGYYSVVAYTDLDANGAWDVENEPSYATNWDGVPPLELMYLKAVGFDAKGFAWLFGGTGWVLYEDGAGYYGLPARASFADGIQLGESASTGTPTTP